MKAWIAALASLIPLAALLVLASPATLTVSLANFPSNFTKFQAYSQAGDLVAEGAVTGNQFSFEYDGMMSYAVKVEGDKAAAVFTIPTGLTSTTYTVAAGQLANITVKVTFMGPGFKPATVTYTVSTPVGVNVTLATGKQFYAQPTVKLSFPESLLFPAIYGYRLANMSVDGAPVDTAVINTTGQHTVEVSYEAAGLATIEPLYLFAGIGIVAVLIALFAMRRSGVQSAVVALRSPYLEK